MENIRCFNSFEEIADFQRQQDAERQQRREEWIKSNPYLRDPLNNTPVEDDPFHRVYDRGESIDVPLKELIETTKEEIKTRTKKHRPIDPIANIRIYQDDYENGNYNLRFYGQTLPDIIKQTQRLVRKDSPIKTYDEICEYLDSPDFYVGRSEDELLEKVADIPVKDEAFYKAPSWRIFRRYLKDIDELFTETEDTQNRKAARTAALKCLERLTRANAGKPINGNGVRQGFDLAARLGDYLGYDMQSMFENLRYGITNDPHAAGYYRSGDHYLAVNPKYTSDTRGMSATIFHELFHAIDARLDVDSFMEGMIPKSGDLTDEMQEAFDVFDDGEADAMSVQAYDPVRLDTAPDDPYAALRYLLKRYDNGDKKYGLMSEFITELLSNYIARPDLLNKEWVHQVLTAFAAQQDRNKSKKNDDNAS